MKNSLNLLAAVTIVVLSGLGCGFVGGGSDTVPANNSNRSLSDRAIDSTVGRSKVGVSECDQVLDAIEVELNNPDDNFVVKAAKATVLNRIKERIRQKIEQNANNTELATTCRDFKAQFDKYKSEQQNKNSQQ